MISLLIFLIALAIVGLSMILLGISITTKNNILGSISFWSVILALVIVVIGFVVEAFEISKEIKDHQEKMCNEYHMKVYCEE